MKKNKVVALLTALSAKELKLFEKFVRNPHHNKKEAVIRLYEFIVKYHAAQNVRKFTKEKCFLYVFPNLKPKFDKLKGKTDELITQNLKNPLSYLKKLIEEFIVQQELIAEQHDKTLLLIKGFFKRQLREKAFQLIDKELKRLEALKAQDFYHHFYQFRLRELKEQACLDIVSADQNFFLKMVNDLDLFFLHSKLKFGYEVKNREILFGQKNDVYLYEVLFNVVDNFKIKNTTPAIQLYKKVSNLNSKNSLNFYLETKQFYLHNFNLLYVKDQKEILIYLFNFCLKFWQDRESETEKDRFEELFSLYEFGLYHDLFLVSSYLSADHFKNIIIASSSLEKFKWARNFIKTKSHLLLPNVRESIVLLAKAQIEDADRNNEKVISLLQNVEFSNAYDNITARSLLLRAYYELGEWHTLEYFLESYTKYLVRNKSISQNVRLSLINMIKFTKTLMEVGYKNSKKKDLKQKLNQLSPIYSKHWFIRKIELLFQ